MLSYNKEKRLDNYEEIRLIHNKTRSRLSIVMDSVNKRLAIKRVLNYEENIYKVFLKLKEIHDENIVEIYDIIKIQNQLVIIEEFIEGNSLDDLIRNEFYYKNLEAVNDTMQQFRLDDKKFLCLLKQLCKALKALHKQEIIHRDIKPSNIIITENNIVKIIDFDAARQKKTENQKDTKYLGTEGYAPPEQYGFSQTDGRADIYALGITIKEILGEDYKGKYKKIIAKCTQIDPKKRYQCIEAIEKDIKYIQNPSLKRINYLAITVFIVSIIVLATGIQDSNDNIKNTASDDLSTIGAITSDGAIIEAEVTEKTTEEALSSEKADNQIKTTDVELRYYTNRSKEEEKGIYFTDEKGSIKLGCDGLEPLLAPSVTDLIPDVKYVTSTIPFSMAIITLQNNSDKALIKPEVKFEFTDIWVWDSNFNDDKSYELIFSDADFVNAIGAYTAAEWKFNSNVYSGAGKTLNLYFGEAAVIGENPAVTVTITAENMEKKQFTIPIVFASDSDYDE